MFQIAGGIILAIVFILVGLRLIARYILWKEEKEENKRVKRRRQEEDDRTREYLQALERGDENAKKGKDYYFKHKPFKLDLSNSFSKRFPKESEIKDKKIEYSDNFGKRYIIGFCIICIVGAIIIIGGLISKI